MRAVVIELSFARAALTLLLAKLSKSAYYGPLSMVSFRNDHPEPKLPGDKWVKINSVLSGICGSDIRLITLSESFYLFPLTSFPIIPGHEVVGIIEEKGKSVENFQEGDRVVVEPTLPCKVRGFDDECPSCKKGSYATCYNLDRGSIAPGLFTGFCRDTGGAWADYFLAHEFQLFRVPDQIRNENAVLTEPFSIAIHAVLKAFPSEDESVAVIGCGTIGICVISALRGLGFKGEIIGIDAGSFQTEMAEKFGADKTVCLERGEKPVEKIAEFTGGRVYHPPRDKPMFVGGGVDVVFECVGDEATIDTALRIVKPGGKIVLGGTAAKLSLDWAPVFSKEVEIVGTFGCGLETVNGERKRTFEIALELLKRIDLSPLLTHKFPIEQYKKALWTAMNKSKTGAGKVAFTF